MKFPLCTFKIMLRFRPKENLALIRGNLFPVCRGQVDNSYHKDSDLYHHTFFTDAPQRLRFPKGTIKPYFTNSFFNAEVSKSA